MTTKQIRLYSKDKPTSVEEIIIPDLKFMKNSANRKNPGKLSDGEYCDIYLPPCVITISKTHTN